MRLSFIYLILNFILALDLHPQQVKILKPKEIKFSTPFSLIIEVENYNITSVSTQSIKDSDFEFISLKLKDKKAITELIPFNVGISTLPSLTLTLDGNLREIKTPPLPLEIKPLYNPKENDQIKDITPIFEFLWWLKLLIMIILILLAYLIYKKIKSKKNLNQYQISIDTRTPYEKAIDRLKELIAKKLIEQNKVKEYYTELSDIVRTYIEEEFKIPATQLTSNELIRKLKNEFKIEIIIILREFFEISDLVKFAKYLPEIERINKNTQDAENLITLMNNHSIEKRKKEEEERLKKEVEKR